MGSCIAPAGLLGCPERLPGDHTVEGSVATGRTEGLVGTFVTQQRDGSSVLVVALELSLHAVGEARGGREAGRRWGTRAPGGCRSVSALTRTLLIPQLWGRWTSEAGKRRQGSWIQWTGKGATGHPQVWCCSHWGHFRWVAGFQRNCMAMLPTEARPSSWDPASAGGFCTNISALFMAFPSMLLPPLLHLL